MELHEASLPELPSCKLQLYFSIHMFMVHSYVCLCEGPGSLSTVILIIDIIAMSTFARGSVKSYQDDAELAAYYQQLEDRFVVIYGRGLLS